MKDTRSTIVRLLNNIGGRKEVEQYLKRFSSVDSTRFAVIKVGGAILRDDLDSLASSLDFLYRVGLYPIVIHGGGVQLNEALELEGIDSERIDGMRVTSPEVLDVARRVFRGENLRLVEALESLGTRARPVTSGVFRAEFMDRDTYGMVGEVTDIDLELLRSSVRSGSLPIVSCLGETAGGQIVNINADVAAHKLALRIEPFKIIFLTGTGGLLDQYGRIIESVNLAEDYDHLMGQDWVHSGMRLKLQQIKSMLDELPADSSVSITTPDHLAKELFTHRGSGTLVRRGESILRFDEAADVDRGRIATLLESCFGRALTPGYWDEKEFFRFYVSSEYRATAVLTLEDQMPYLDKFGVTEKAQGEGLGGSTWLRMKEENPKLFWRSRVNNPINTWYFQEAQGSYQQDEWVVFWYGMESFEEMKQCVDMALSMPATLEEPAPLTQD
jgi:acetylglutamate kinase